MIHYLATFDDGNAEDIRIADLMDKYEIPTIFFWPVDMKEVNQRKNRSYLTYHQAKQIASKFLIGSHTITHPLLPEIDPKHALIEVVASRTALQRLYNQPIEAFCYPRGRNNPQIKKMVKNAGYLWARGTEIGNIYAAKDPYNAKTSVHVGYPRKEYGDQHWLLYALKLLKFARKKAEEGEDIYFSIWGHGAEIHRYQAWNDLENLLKEMNA